MQVSGRGVQLVCKDEVERRDTCLVVENDTLRARNRINEAEVEQRGDSPALVLHGGLSKSIFAHLIPAQGVDFPSCERCGVDDYR